MNGLKRHLTVANVLSCMALFVALSGVAYAAGLAKNSVKAKNIAKGAVTAAKLKNGAVSNGKIANGAVSGGKLANNSISNAKLADQSVTGAKIANTTIGAGKIANGAVTSAKLGQGSATTDKIADGAVNVNKLASSVLADYLSTVSYASASSAVDSSASAKTVTVNCPSGKQAIGGGAIVVGGSTAGVALTQTDESVNPTTGKVIGWTARAELVGTGTPTDWGVQAHVVCAFV